MNEGRKRKNEKESGMKQKCGGVKRQIGKPVFSNLWLQYS